MPRPHESFYGYNPDDVIRVGGPKGKPGLSIKGDKGDKGDPGNNYDIRVANEYLGGHRVVRSTGAVRVGYADCTDSTHGDDTVGLTLGAANVDEEVNVQRIGSISFNGWVWVPGESIFLGINGILTQDVPDPLNGATFMQVIGHAEDITTVYLSIDPPIYFED